MGRSHADVIRDVSTPYAFATAGDSGGMVRLQTVVGVKSPVQVSAEILATLRQRAEATFDNESSHADASFVTGNGHSINGCLPDAWYRGDHFRYFHGCHILALPSEGVADAINKIEETVVILFH